jgi:hypothetical protein
LFLQASAPLTQPPGTTDPPPILPVHHAFTLLLLLPRRLPSMGVGGRELPLDSGVQTGRTTVCTGPVQFGIVYCKPPTHIFGQFENFFKNTRHPTAGNLSPSIGSPCPPPARKPYIYINIVNNFISDLIPCQEIFLGYTNFLQRKNDAALQHYTLNY